MDREGKDPFDLLDELEEELMIQVRPLSWPIEQGARFKGVYNIYEQKLDLYQPSKQMVTEKVEVDIHTEELDQQIGKPLADKLRGDLELIEGVYPELDVESYLAGDCAPVFFGSALNNFGVQELLNCFVEIAPSPRPVQAEERGQRIANLESTVIRQTDNIAGIGLINRCFTLCHKLSRRRKAHRLPVADVLIRCITHKLTGTNLTESNT